MRSSTRHSGSWQPSEVRSPFVKLTCFASSKVSAYVVFWAGVLQRVSGRAVPGALGQRAFQRETVERGGRGGRGEEEGGVMAYHLRDGKDELDDRRLHLLDGESVG